MNSPHFDKISHINISYLYEELKNKKIPYNKWQEEIKKILEGKVKVKGAKEVKEVKGGKGVKGRRWLIILGSKVKFKISIKVHSKLILVGKIDQITDLAKLFVIF